nr:hypothetical protein [Tanacetum cinerariifolium]
WTGLPKFTNDTVTDYSRPSPTVESTSTEGQNKNSTAAENEESTDSILSKPAIKFVKAGDKPAERPTTDKVETAKKPAVRYAEMYRRTSKRSSGHKPHGAPMRPPLRSSGHRPHESSTQVPEGSGNPNPTASSSNPLTNQMETLTVESPIPTVTSPTPTLRIHKDHPKSQIIGPVDTLIQTRHKSKMMEEQSFIATIHQKTDPALLQFYLFSCFLSQVEPKKKVWTLVDCPKGVRPIETKWVLKNKKDERGIIVRNKARLVAQGHTQEEGVDYDEVFPPVVRIEAIRLFLAYASFMGFTVYQMDVNSAFLYGTIDEEVYVMQPPGFQDPAFPAKVYKVEKAMYGFDPYICN